jgi:hypothetical protein
VVTDEPSTLHSGRRHCASDVARVTCSNRVDAESCIVLLDRVECRERDDACTATALQTGLLGALGVRPHLVVPTNLEVGNSANVLVERHERVGVVHSDLGCEQTSVKERTNRRTVQRECDRGHRVGGCHVLCGARPGSCFCAGRRRLGHSELDLGMTLGALAAIHTRGEGLGGLEAGLLDCDKGEQHTCNRRSGSRAWTSTLVRTIKTLAG